MEIRMCSDYYSRYRDCENVDGPVYHQSLTVIWHRYLFDRYLFDRYLFYTVIYFTPLFILHRYQQLFDTVIYLTLLSPIIRHR